MDLREHLALMAGYQHWAYRRLFDVLRGVDDADYRRDLGLHFRSIHGTLNHLLVADRLWYARFAAPPAPALSLDQELESDRGHLEQALLAGTLAWRTFLEDLDPALLDGDLSYHSTLGRYVVVPHGPTLAHVFNHATHHRGQISAAVTRLGAPAPEMDLVYYLVERQAA